MSTHLTSHAHGYGGSAAINERHGRRHHSHSHADIVAANKAYFDENAKKYDDRPDVQEMARRLVSAIRRIYPDLFDEDSTTVLDYACGTGVLSRELCPFVKSIVGVDISTGMVNQYNFRVANQGLSPDDMQALCVELKDESHKLDGRKFDVVICSMSYHHFSSIEDTTRLLAYFLKSGGSLLIADIARNEEGVEIFPENRHIVPHQHGFTKAEIDGVFARAGLANFTFEQFTTAKLHGTSLNVFLARGVKL